MRFENLGLMIEYPNSYRGEEFAPKVNGEQQEKLRNSPPHAILADFLNRKLSLKQTVLNITQQANQNSDFTYLFDILIENHP